MQSVNMKTKRAAFLLSIIFGTCNGGDFSFYAKMTLVAADNCQLDRRIYDTNS